MNGANEPRWCISPVYGTLNLWYGLRISCKVHVNMAEVNRQNPSGLGWLFGNPIRIQIRGVCIPIQERFYHALNFSPKIKA